MAAPVGSMDANIDRSFLDFMIDTKTALAAINCKRKTEYSMIKPLQVQALRKAIKGDTIAVLPTGYGKSLIFELLQKMTGKVIIVCSPLNAIIEEQVSRHGDDAIKVESQVIDTPNFKTAHYAYVFGHPEQLLEDKVLKVFSSGIWEERVGHIVVDEAHCVVSWGQCFREKFKELNRLRAVFPKSSLLCLTATATGDMRKEITRILGLVSPALVIGPVNRPNIKLVVKKRSPITGGNNTSEGSFVATLEPYVEELLSQKAFPRTIIYTKLNYCGLGYETVMQRGKMCGKDLSGCVSQYHAPSKEHEKSSIGHDMQKAEGNLCLLFATEAYSMGTDSPNIHRVVHIGVPYNMETYVQETGRAGRDGHQSEAIMYYNNNDIGTNVKNLKPVMQDYCRTEECRRQYLDRHFGLDPERTEEVDRHNCCDNCQRLCECDACKEATASATDEHAADIARTSIQHTELNMALRSYFDAENSTIDYFGNPPILTALTSKLADEISGSSNPRAALNNYLYLNDHYLCNIRAIIEHFITKD